LACSLKIAIPSVLEDGDGAELVGIVFTDTETKARLGMRIARADDLTMNSYGFVRI
jgi:hypothetical protein